MNKIKELRKQHKMTQQQLGNLLGVKKAAVQKYESGVIKNLKQDTLLKLAEVFNVPIATFLYQDLEEHIRKEVFLLDELKIMYGADTIEVLNLFTELNEINKRKILIFLDDLTALQYFQNK